MVLSPQLNELVEEEVQSLFAKGVYVCVFNTIDSIGTINDELSNKIIERINKQLKKEETTILGIYKNKEPLTFEIEQNKISYLSGEKISK